MFTPFVAVGLLAIVGLVGVVAHLRALITVWFRKEWETEKRAIWFLIMFVTGGVGSIVYYFITKQKGWAWMMLISIVLFMILYFSAIAVLLATGLGGRARY